MLILSNRLNELNDVAGKNEDEILDLIYGEDGIEPQFKCWNALAERVVEWSCGRAPNTEIINKRGKCIDAEDELYSEEFGDYWQAINVACMNQWFRKHTAKYEAFWKVCTEIRSCSKPILLYPDEMDEMLRTYGDIHRHNEPLVRECLEMLQIAGENQDYHREQRYKSKSKFVCEWFKPSEMWRDYPKDKLKTFMGWYIEREFPELYKML